MFRLWVLLIGLLLTGVGSGAHPMPNSVLLLDIKDNGVSAELQWPLNEFQLAFPDENIDSGSAMLLARKGAWLDAYLRQHLHVSDTNGRAWSIAIEGKKLETSQQEATTAFKELVFTLWFQPPAGSSPRHFTMNYDAIMHQVVTHKMLIRIRQDWDGGLSAKDSLEADLGVLMVNTGDGKVPPLIVNLDEGSRWTGFKSMVSLGMEHIAEGTDHLLFLLVLLLPAPLLVKNGHWKQFGGTRYSVSRLLKIVTAFTIGHSITLLAGAIGWLRLPSQPVEILIAFSILVTAIHALWPVFPGREVFVAVGFGLVHGLAFAGTLAGLELGADRMALSILGFNIGIELMQLFIILIIVPWLILLADSPLYRFIRIAGALAAGTAAIAWMLERWLGKPNAVAVWVQEIASHGKWMILALVALAIGWYFVQSREQTHERE